MRWQSRSGFFFFAFYLLPCDRTQYKHKRIYTHIVDGLIAMLTSAHLMCVHVMRDLAFGMSNERSTALGGGATEQSAAFYTLWLKRKNGLDGCVCVWVCCVRGIKWCIGKEKEWLKRQGCYTWQQRVTQYRLCFAACFIVLHWHSNHFQNEIKALKEQKNWKAVRNTTYVPCHSTGIKRLCISNPYH